jgi:hypothetical protein
VAQYLEAYIRNANADWEIYFTLGLARMPTEERDRAALRAYNHALRLIPIGRPNNLTARLFSSRAAVEKRLGRLTEGKADAEKVKQLASGTPTLHRFIHAYVLD